jgi:ATP-dependent Clp protease ATP-binding subunit ClpB
MRLDKFTTKLQEALADAQSMAVGNDHPYIETQHLILAMLQQSDGSSRSLLQRAGVNVNGLQNALKQSLERLPKVSGNGGQVQLGRELGGLLNLADKEAQKRQDQFLASEMVLLALTEDKSDTSPKKTALPAALSKPLLMLCVAVRRLTARKRKASAKP